MPEDKIEFYSGSNNAARLDGILPDVRRQRKVTLENRVEIPDSSISVVVDRKL